MFLCFFRFVCAGSSLYRISGWTAGQVRTIYIQGFQPGFYRNRKPSNPEFFQNRKTGFWLPVNPVFSVLNFVLQMSNYATVLTQTACSVHDSMFFFVYIYHSVTTGNGIPALQVYRYLLKKRKKIRCSLKFEHQSVLQLCSVVRISLVSVSLHAS